MSQAAEQGLVGTALPEVVALIEVVCATLVVTWLLVPTVSDIARYSFDQETGDTTPPCTLGDSVSRSICDIA